MQTRSSPSLQTLHRLARQANIDDYESMPKTLLFDTLKRKCNIDRLLRIENRRQESAKGEAEKRKRKRLYSPSAIAAASSSAGPDMAKKAASKPPLNKIDPIMMIPIGKRKTFKFTRPNGTMVQFNVESLVDYLLASGDFTDPETRIPFSDDNLADIDRLAVDQGLAKASVLAARNDTHKYSDAKFRRDALLGLERCAGEVITDMLEIVETYDPDDAQMQLVTAEFPAFLDYFRQLRSAEAEYASKCLAHWRLFMTGPPNRPNHDEFGLIHVILHFLKNCEDGRI